MQRTFRGAALTASLLVSVAPAAAADWFPYEV
jgi:hypothetical protein